MEADLGSMEAKEGDNVSAGDAFRKRALGKKIVVDGVFRTLGAFQVPWRRNLGFF